MARRCRRCATIVPIPTKRLSAIPTTGPPLQVRTPTAIPAAWATTLHNLGAAYVDWPGGERAENLELAIAAYRDALRVRTRRALPSAWAATMNNLGVAYTERVRGERAEN